jgi:hypothetical protein
MVGVHQAPVKKLMKSKKLARIVQFTSEDFQGLDVNLPSGDTAVSVFCGGLTLSGHCLLVTQRCAVLPHGLSILLMSDWCCARACCVTCSQWCRHLGTYPESSSRTHHLRPTCIVLACPKTCRRAARGITTRQRLARLLVGKLVPA